MSDEYTRLCRWVWFALKVGIGSRSSDQLTDAFHGDIDALYEASADECRDACLARGQTLTPRLYEALADKSTFAAEEVLRRCNAASCRVLTQDNSLYPMRLRRIERRPVILYVRGTLHPLDELVTIGMVGTRAMTAYGQQNGYTIAYDLARSDAVVVSGMAKGLDGIAHRGALDAGGYTIAVLGCGVDVVYPKEHDELMQELARHGCILSEYPPGTIPAGRNFPLRNRIISGLSLGVMVVEAGPGSGALITAEYARTQGRDLFALPGKAGEYNSLGTNELIRQGATMATKATDILELYRELYPHTLHVDRIPSQRMRHISLEELAKRPSYRHRLAVLEKKAAEAADNTDVVTVEKTAAPEPVPEAEPAPVSVSKPKKKKKDAPPAETPPTTVPTFVAPEPAPAALPPEGSHQRAVYDAIPKEADITPDALAEATGLPIMEILPALTILEIKHLIEPAPGGAVRIPRQKK